MYTRVISGCYYAVTSIDCTEKFLTEIKLPLQNEKLKIKINHKNNYTTEFSPNGFLISL